jgi:hypothetical protein
MQIARHLEGLSQISLISRNNTYFYWGWRERLLFRTATSQQEQHGKQDYEPAHDHKRLPYYMKLIGSGRCGLVRSVDSGPATGPFNMVQIAL